MSLTDKSAKFAMSLGNVLPKSAVVIRIKYITQLTAQDGKLCFTLPLAYAPSVTSKNKVTVSANIKMPTAITLLESPTHPKEMKSKDVSPSEKNVSFAFNGKNKDFVLLIGHANPHVPYAHVTPDARYPIQTTVLFAPS